MIIIVLVLVIVITSSRGRGRDGRVRGVRGVGDGGGQLDVGLRRRFIYSTLYNDAIYV